MEVASDLRFRVAICEAETPAFCGIFGDFGSVSAESLAIAIVRFWCAKGGGSSTCRGGGGNWVRPRPRRPPPVTVLGIGNVYGLYSGQLRPYVLAWCLLLCLGMFVWQSFMRSCWLREDRLRVGPTKPLGVTAICLASCLGIAPLGAVTMVGGSSDPSVPWSPGMTLQRRQGGPWAPPPCGVNSSGKLLWCLSGQYSGSSGSCLLFAKPLVFLRGRRFCFCSCEPFTTRPMFGVCMRPSFSSVWLISSATFLSLFLSLRRWGNPNPIWGLGFPL